MDTHDSLQIDQIPARFWPAVRRIQHLHTLEPYQAAYLFGSVVRGDTTAESDLDVHVLVDHPHPCANMNHPIINGVKLDITFCSLGQLTMRTQHELAKGDRIPMVAESLIVFDKTGELTHVRIAAQQTRPKPCTPAEHHAIQFLVFHANDKAERFLATDPRAALLVMHTSLLDLVQTHYRIHARWRVSDKRLLRDLRGWDSALARLIEQLVATVDVTAKFAIWTTIIDYVLAPLGGRQPIATNNCSCAICQHHLAVLTSA